MTAIGGIYSYKIMSFLLPIMTLTIIWLEGGIKNISLRFPPPLVFLLLLLAWIGMSVFWAENQVVTLTAFIPLILTFTFSFLFLSCLMQATPRFTSKAYVIINISGLMLMLLIIFQIYIDTFLGGVINYQGLASYMLRMKPTGSILGLTAFVSCAFLWVYRNKTFALLAFLLIFLLIILTLCQTAIYGIILAILVFGLSYVMPFWITRMGMIFSYTFLFFSPFLYTDILSAATVSNSIYFQWILNKNLFHRWLAWEYYSKKFFEKPLLGWGLESSRYMPTESELAPGFNNLLHPHNNSIQVYAELGIIGGILYALFFSSLFYMVEKHVKDRLSIAVCNATITFGFVCAEITHNVWRNYWLSLAALTAGLIIIFLKAREEQLHARVDHLLQLPAQ